MFFLQVYKNAKNEHLTCLYLFILSQHLKFLIMSVTRGKTSYPNFFSNFFIFETNLIFVNSLVLI